MPRLTMNVLFMTVKNCIKLAKEQRASTYQMDFLGLGLAVRGYGELSELPEGKRRSRGETRVVAWAIPLNPPEQRSQLMHHAFCDRRATAFSRSARGLLFLLIPKFLPVLASIMLARKSCLCAYKLSC